MSLFNWSDEYSVGSIAMDQHHKQLFSMINALYAMDVVEVKTNLIPMLEQLIAYATFHFGEEERLMEQAKYVGLTLQRMAHQQFVKRLKSYMEKLRNNPGMSVFIANEVSMTASDWLKEHIIKSDKEYASSLRNAGLI